MDDDRLYVTIRSVPGKLQVFLYPLRMQKLFLPLLSLRSMASDESGGRRIPLSWANVDTVML